MSAITSIDNNQSCQEIKEEIEALTLKLMNLVREKDNGGDKIVLDDEVVELNKIIDGLINKYISMK